VSGEGCLDEPVYVPDVAKGDDHVGVHEPSGPQDSVRLMAAAARVNVEGELLRAVPSGLIVPAQAGHLIPAARCQTLEELSRHLGKAGVEPRALAYPQ